MSCSACLVLSRSGPRHIGTGAVHAKSTSRGEVLQTGLLIEAGSMNQCQIGTVKISQVVEIGPSPTLPKFFFKHPLDDLVARRPWRKPHFANYVNRSPGMASLRTPGCSRWRVR